MNRVGDGDPELDVVIERLIVDLPEGEPGDELAISEEIADEIFQRLESLFD